MEITPVSSVRALRHFVRGYRTQAVAAAELKISAPYLTDMLYGRRPVPKRILSRLGLRRREFVVRTHKEGRS